eukprot:PITA_26484
MVDEMASLHKNEAWDLVELLAGRKPIDRKWVFKKKTNAEGKVEKYNARLVAKGYSQVPGIDFGDIFSPVGTVTSIKLLLSVASTFDFEVKQMDLKTTFLHGDLEEEIYMKQPEGFAMKGKKELVCKLKKSLYGLKQSPRMWYQKFDTFIGGLGFTRRKADHYVSFQLIGSKPVKVHIPVGVKLSVEQCPKTQEEEDDMSRVPYASAVDNLMHVMVCTRPDIAHAVGVLSRFMSKPGKEHWTTEKQVFRYLCGTSDYGLCYQGRPRLDRVLDICGFVDVNSAGDLDQRRSTSGYVFNLFGGAVSWISKKQFVVALSTTEAEYMGATHASKEVFWLQRLCSSTGLVQGAIRIYCDSQSAIFLANNHAYHSRKSTLTFSITL